jgi:hypothetical protein
MRLEPAQSAKDDPVVLVSGYAVHDESVSYTADGDRYASSNLVSGTIWRWRPNAVGDDQLSEACALVASVLLRCFKSARSSSRPPPARHNPHRPRRL